MENLQLIEKQAAARGIGDLKINWAKMAGPSVMVDAIISGNLHFSAQGVPSLALMWDRTKGGVGVKAISAVTNTDIYLNTRNPNIKSIRDFTDKDRIAVPSVKVSTQALFLQIAVEKEWGPGQHGKLGHRLLVAWTPLERNGHERADADDARRKPAAAGLAG
jgi:NitT/TauT family transport system substrate-binding protein